MMKNQCRSIAALAVFVSCFISVTVTQTFAKPGNKDRKEVTATLTGERMLFVEAMKTRKNGGEALKIHQEGELRPVIRYRVDPEDAPSRGLQDAKVTILEFSDFECPFSKKAQPVIDNVLKKYPREVRHVFKQHPLPFHKHALPAAEASLAADFEGKFWEMKDMLFENQKQLEQEKLVEYAKRLMLDMDRFNADLRTHRFKTQVEKESRQAVEIGIKGTPAFFINGRFLSGAKNLESFVKIIDEELSGKEIAFKWGANVIEETIPVKDASEQVLPSRAFEIPILNLPAVITSLGQSQDADSVAALARSVGLKIDHNNHLSAKEVSKYKTLIMAVGINLDSGT